MNKLIELFKQVNIPIVYKNSKRAGIKVPYGVYFRTNPQIIYADNKNYVKKEVFKLELYFSNLKQQLEIEEKLENMLSDGGFLFSKELDVEISDEISMVVYKIGGL